jgi:tRNA(fMet)-specific endonuclease VapC
MAVLIDADVVLEAERGRFDLFRWLEEQSDEEFLLAAITVAELWRGVERAEGHLRLRRQQFVERIVDTFEVVPYTEETARVHARLLAEAERTGFKVGAHALLVGAMALELDGAVATFNARYFAFIPGLRVIQLP